MKSMTMMPPMSRKRSWRPISFSRLEIVLEHRVFEIRRTDKLACVHVDDRQRLGAIDDEMATGRQPYAPIECLAELILDVEPFEQAEIRILITVHAIEQVRCGLGEVLDDGLVGLVVIEHEPAEISREVLADDPDQQAGLLVDGSRRLAAFDLTLDRFPALHEALDVRGDLVGRSGGGGGANDDAETLRPSRPR